MDHFGIGAAMKTANLIYSQAARRTGRTTSLVESLKDGDRVVFIDRIEAERVQRLCRERRVKVNCIVMDVKDPHELMRRAPSEGRTLFDHTWVERFYLHQIDQASQAIDQLQRNSSGFGTAHIETRRTAIELSKWDVEAAR
jgi:hypothetical protein